MCTSSLPPSPKIPQEMVDWADHDVLEGRCIKRISSNLKWDEETGGHATGWLPVRVKASFYDDEEGTLCFDPFIFTDEDSTYERKEDGTIAVHNEREFYEFRRSSVDQGRTPTLAP